MDNLLRKLLKAALYMFLLCDCFLLSLLRGVNNNFSYMFTHSIMRRAALYKDIMGFVLLQF
jgi:hypothetical protein